MGIMMRDQLSNKLNDSNGSFEEFLSKVLNEIKILGKIEKGEFTVKMKAWRMKDNRLTKRASDLVERLLSEYGKITNEETEAEYDVMPPTLSIVQEREKGKFLIKVQKKLSSEELSITKLD